MKDQLADTPYDLHHKIMAYAFVHLPKKASLSTGLIGTFRPLFDKEKQSKKNCKCYLAAVAGNTLKDLENVGFLCSF